MAIAIQQRYVAKDSIELVLEASESNKAIPDSIEKLCTQRGHRSGGDWEGSQVPAVPAQEGASPNVADQPAIFRFGRRAGS